MRLILVRHGETKENKLALYQGGKVGRLNRLGILQGKKLALRLKEEKFDIIISSDADRTKYTSKLIHKYHKKKPLIYEPLVREINRGTLVGKPKALHPQFDYYHEKPHLLSVSKRPPKGESYNDLRKRVIRFWNILKKRYAGKNVLIVSHAVFNRQLLGHLLGKTVKESVTLEQGNTAVNIIAVDEKGNHTVHLVGCIKHL